MRAYIDILGTIALLRYELTTGDLRNIGEFTRANVSRWMESHTDPGWVGILPVEDFHAVCGNIDIPWATENAGLRWAEAQARFAKHTEIGSDCGTAPSL